MCPSATPTARSTKGGAKIIKQKLSHLDEILAEAEKTGDLSAVAAHIITLTGGLADLKSSKLAAILATRCLQWFHEAGTLCDNSAIIGYMIEYRRKYAGRGIPVIFDNRLGTKAQAKVMSMNLSLKSLISSSVRPIRSQLFR